MSDRATVLRRALSEIETLRRRVAELEAGAEAAGGAEAPRAGPVAVVGMACRLPGGVVDPDGFWQLLAGGVDATREVPTDRWPDDGIYAPEPAAGRSYVRRGGYLEDVAGFDPAFFGLSPREVRRMDPQQRLLLETHWEALERAGQPIDALVGSATGVFVGNTTSDFAHLQMKYLDLALLDGHYLTGNSPSFLAGRIAFHFGLQGPAFAVDTSCSSSLVAVHLACQSLERGESDLALASGVNLMLFPELNASLCGARMLARDGRCKTFDAGADGYARGEGCATVVLKRLADARKDRDPIVAVIRGTAINHDGRSSGITVPNGAAQQAVLRRALDRAGIAPAEVGYLEAHGTGTSLGDPIEVRALGAVLGEGRRTPLVLGSVKTNFGHLEGAAGIAGLIKVILTLDRGTIPPHLNLGTLNPAIELDSVPARVATAAEPWPPSNGRPRIAGVSSFGASGTNAHALVSSPPPVAETEADAGRPTDEDRSARRVLALSARDETALRQLAGRFAQHLEAHPDQDLADVCHTANVGRPRLRHRLALSDVDGAGMVSRLAAVAAGETPPGVVVGALPRAAGRWGRAGAPVAFLFTGQGAQAAGMGRGLYQREPTFRRAIERCDAGLRGELERPLIDVLYGAHGDLLAGTDYTQPALFAVGFALAETWQAWGVSPAAVLGHSVGEVTAACVAGVLGFDDALRLIARRGRSMQALAGGGAMAAVALGEEAAGRAIAGHRDALAVAAVNGPTSTVLSGDRECLDQVIAELRAAGVKTKALAVSHAFHSPRIDPALDELEAAAAGIAVEAPRRALIANVTGRAVDPATDDPVFGSPGYWRRQARAPVRFSDGVASLAGLGIDLLLELGPTPALLPMARQCPVQGEDGRVFVPTLRRGRDDLQQMAGAVAELFVRGAAIDWRGVDSGRQRRRLALPTYPFQRHRFWIEPEELAAATPAAASPAAFAGDAIHPFLGPRLPSPLPGAQFAVRYGCRRQPMLADFAVFGHVVVNIGVYVEAFAAAARVAFGASEAVLDEIVMPQALLLDAEGDRAVQVVVGAGQDGEHPVEVYARQADVDAGDGDDDRPDGWTRYAGARLRAGAGDDASVPHPMPPSSLRPADADELDGVAFYRAMEARGLKLGPAARWIEHVWRRPRGDAREDRGAALARIRRPTAEDGVDRFGLHPGLIDSCFQLFFATLAATGAEAEPDALFMLVGVARLRVVDLPADRAASDTVLWCRVRRDAAREGHEPGQVVAGDLLLVTDDGQPVLSVEGAELRRVDRAALERSLDAAAGERRGAGGRADTGASDADRHAALAALDAAEPAERPALARRGAVEAVAEVLGFAFDAVDPEQPLSELGIDSLLALELRAALGRKLGVAPPLARILEGPTPARLGAQALDDIVAATGAQEEPTDRAGAETEGAPEQVAERAEPIDLALPPVVPDPANRFRPFPFTDLQEAYFFGRSGAFELGNVSTWVTMEIEVTDLDVERLDAAWQRMIDRHEMLRAVFLPEGRQRILPRPPRPFVIRYRDLAPLDDAPREAALLAIREEMVAQVLPADGWPLFDLRVSHLGSGRCRLHIGLDALVMDAWGTSVVLKEWAAVYHRPTLALPPLELSFRDYALALAKLEETPVYRRDLAYWLERVDRLPPAPELPLVADPSSLPRPDFVRRGGRLEAPVWQRLKERATAAGLTPSTMMCALYATVLAAWSKSQRFTLNVLYFNRPPLHPEVNDLAANLSATVLLEVDARQPMPFVERARALARRFWDDLEHSHVTGVRVLREYNRRHAGRAQAGMPVVFASTLALDVRQGDLPSGLFQHLLGLGSDGAVVHTTARTPQVMLDHQIMEEDGALVFNWDAVEALFPPGLLDDMFGAYRALLDRLAADDEAWHAPPEDAVHGLLPADQRARRVAVNATEAPVPEGLLHQPFLDRARADPERAAVIAADRTLSYGELSRRAHALALRLRAAGVQPNDLVGVVIEKGWPQVVAVLAVALAGGAYLPIDPGLPPARVRYLLAHGRVAVALLHGDIDPLAATEDGWPEGVERMRIEDRPPAEEPEPLAPAQTARDLAYVIFTSGSTGLPKGVMIDHRGALNTVLDVNRRFAIGPEDRVLALSALNFDLSVWDIFGLLAAGGALVMPPPDALREPARWSELLEQHRVTVWNSVPALAEMWADSRPAAKPGAGALRLVMMSGDWIPVTLPDRLRSVAPGVAVVSLGGATEASIWSISFPVDQVDPAWTSIPYGRPMDNQRFHVLDGALAARPDWVPGELYIAGTGVALGYLRDTERTAASFLEHPVTGERLYRTGDLGRYRSDGTIEFLGREDLQVKIQGYRIELGEIEVALAQHPAVAGCAVVAQGAARGNKRLVAFVVPAAVDAADTRAAEALAERLRAALGEQIAGYMIPSALVVVPALPLTANGKVDRGALAAWDAGAGRDNEAPAATAPRDPVEGELAALWQQLLERDRVGVHDDFFELGGHSLLAVRLMTAIASRFGRELPLAAIFEGRTVENLAALVRDRDGATSDGGRIAVPIRAATGSVERPPLFCVHPVSGSVLCYEPLARALGDDQPLYGLQSPPSPTIGEGADDSAAADDLAAMAADYVEAMHAVQAEGPYHLAGWSMGGMVAFEMARQLAASGDAAAFVGLIDVAEPPDGPTREVDDVTLTVWFARDLAGLAGRRPDFRAGHLDGLEAPAAAADRLAALAAWAAAEGVLPPGIDAGRLADLFAVFRRNYRALLAYRPAPYDGAVALYHVDASADVAKAWAARAASATVERLAGDHYSIVRPPRVADLAKRLRRDLDAGVHGARSPAVRERRPVPAGPRG